jgi:hypothetical protein
MFSYITHRMTEEIKTTAVDVFLQLNDIVERTNKFHNEDIDKFVTSTVASKRINPLLKKLYDLETAIGTLRSSIRRVVLSGAVKAVSEAGEGEDPVLEVAVIAATLEEIPKAKKLVTVAAVPKKEEPAVAKEEEVAKEPTKAKKTTAKKDEETEETPKAKKASAAVKKDEETPVAEEAPKTKKASAAAVKKDDEPSVTDDVPKAKKAFAAAKKDDETESAKKPKSAKKTMTGGGGSASAATVATDVESDESSEEDTKAPLSQRRKKIPKAVRTLVWNLHIGSHKGEDRCLCCKEKKIDVANFHCGHVLAESKGGDLTIKNLRPICAACNSAMGARSMNEFTKEFFGWEI